MLYDQLQTLSEQLQSYHALIERDTKKAPSGTLRISNSKGFPKYYHADSRENPNGSYISSKSMGLARQLAQKQYAEQFEKRLLKVGNDLNRLLRHMNAEEYEFSTLLDCCEGLKETRRCLIEPYILTNDEYARVWQEQEYRGKMAPEDPAAFYTERGEYVRSKSELMIANKLLNMDVPYHYEMPFELKNGVLIHPDFTVLNKRTREEYRWEHLGMMDDPAYCVNALQRIKQYEATGLWPGKGLLITHETSQKPLDMKLVTALINEFLM